MDVDYCENSTIVEAWGLIVGLPAPLVGDPAAVITHFGKHQFPDLEPRPAVVAVGGSAKEVIPHWTQQWSWDQGQYLARYGHRYLSVHFLRKGESKYERYAETLRPAISGWLAAYGEAFDHEGHIVDRVGFGYVNQFDIEPDGFDISMYFKLNVSVDVDKNSLSLLGVDTAFRFFDEATGDYLSLNLAAESPTKQNPKIRLTTKVLAEKRGVEGLAFSDRDEIELQLHEAKEAAKACFFGFATERTLAIMRARPSVGD